jgi:REP element-mobilizing transposase RayT
MYNIYQTQLPTFFVQTKEKREFIFLREQQLPVKKTLANGAEN